MPVDAPGQHIPKVMNIIRMYYTAHSYSMWTEKSNYNRSTQCITEKQLQASFDTKKVPLPDNGR